MLGEVEEVFAYKGRRVYGTYAVAIFENGAAALLTSSIASRLGLRNPTVVCLQGTKGTIQTGMSKNGDYTGTLIAKDKVSPIKASKETGHGDRVRTQNIINAIQKDEPLIAPLEDGIKTSEFLHAIWDSYTSGIRIPVHIAEPTG
jgi:predicted dehydrogenase